MKSILNVNDMQTLRATLSPSVGFVPTMGALHDGHIQLIKKSINENANTVVSIFLNPTQFNNKEDFNNYPSSLKKDLNILQELNVDVAFTPQYEDLYPDAFTYQVHENSFSHKLCGADRPGHFNGVLTVVMKLFNIVRPYQAYFGEKDFQQLQLIRNMTKAFFMDVEIIAVPTVREKSGLALSSRNQRLSPEEHHLACDFAEILKNGDSLNEVRQALEDKRIPISYLEDIEGRRFAAVQIGNVRLIDNRLIDNVTI